MRGGWKDSSLCGLEKAIKSVCESPSLPLAMDLFTSALQWTHHGLGNGIFLAFGNGSRLYV